MAKYLFVYHGGKPVKEPSEMKAVMDAWGAWFGSLGSAVVSVKAAFGCGICAACSKAVSCSSSKRSTTAAGSARCFSCCRAMYQSRFSRL